MQHDPPATASAAPASTSTTRPPRVVLVDLDESARAVTAQVLTDSGCAVVAAVDSHARGIVAARTHQPDVIVTELRGGRVLGPSQYVEALRGQCRRAAIIVYATIVPAACDQRAWDLAGALVKVTEAGRLPAAVHSAHEASHATR